jgi:putative protease
MNYAACNALYKAGAKRIILARETPLSEIKRIRAQTPPDLELEAFVHGAMCVSFSGRCLLSSYINNRDANRGECSQPCRWEYHLTEETRPNEFFKVFEDGRGRYILNSKDLCMIEYISQLAEAGLSSLKIEGRAKTAYYTAVITNAYACAIDAYKKDLPLPEWVKREVNCVSHRPYSTGFYFGQAEQYYENSGYIRDCDFIGTVDGYDNGFIEITQRNYFTVNDYIEVIAPQNPPERFVINEMYNSNRARVEIASRATEKLLLRCDRAFPTGAMLRRVNN